MRKKGLLMLFLSIILVLAACSGNKNGAGKDDSKTGQTTSEDLAENQVLNLYDTSEIPSMDTTQATDVVSFTAMDNVFEGLYRLDVDNKPVPGVAKSYNVSNDGLVYTFKLNEKAKWSNGDPVTANDFVYSWRKALAPDTLSQYAYILGVVKNGNAIQTENDPLYGKVDQLGIKAIDDTTLEVTLEYPAPYFLSMTNFATFYPQNQKYVESQGDKYALEADTMIYNGPFVLSEWKHNEGWTYKKNDTYWDKENVKLSEVNYKVLKDTATAVNLYETNKVDRVNLSAEFVDMYKGSAEFRIKPDPTVYFLRFNQGKKELANVNIRKAIDSAYDKKALADVILNNGSVEAYYLIPKDFVKNSKGEDFRKTNGNFGSFDAKKANELFKKGLEELGQDSMELEFLTYDTDASKKLTEYMKNQLEKNLPGLKIKIKPQPFKQKLALEDKKDYDMSYAGWGPDYTDAMTFLDMWITGSGNNQMNYSNKKYDDLVKGAMKEADQNKRWNELIEAEKVLFEDQAISPIYQKGLAQMQKGYVKNVAEHQIGGEYSYKWAYIAKH